MFAPESRRWRLAVPILVTCLALAASLAACRPNAATAPDVQMTLAVSPDPPSVGPAEVTVGLVDSAGKPISGATVRIEGDMTDPGMVPVQAQAQDIGNGRYIARGFNFTMGGDWILTISSTLPSGSQTQKTFPVTTAGRMAPTASDSNSAQAQVTTTPQSGMDMQHGMQGKPGDASMHDSGTGQDP